MALALRDNLHFGVLTIYFAKKLIQQFSINYMQLNNKNSISTIGCFPLLLLFIFRIK